MPGSSPVILSGAFRKTSARGRCFRDSKHFILEGDEYDTAFFDKRSKFIHYLPELVIVNNIEFDHADIYRDVEEIKTSFRRLLSIVPSEGMVLLNADDPNCVELPRTALRRLWKLASRRMLATTYAIRRHRHVISIFEFFGAPL